MLNQYSSHFNPLPPHGGRLIGGIVFCKSGIISIHSLRMEGDLEQPQALRGVLVFQSTPSAWRETCIGSGLADSLCISIHSLRMEGDVVVGFSPDFESISIHSLRMEGDM